MVPVHHMGMVIGRQGETIKDVQARTGAHVQIQRETEMPPGAQERSVTITGAPAPCCVRPTVGAPPSTPPPPAPLPCGAGSPESVAAAKAAIVGMIEAKNAEMGRGGAPGSGYGGGGTLSVPIPDDKVGLVIGRQGATIKGVQARHGVHINVSCERGGGRSACASPPHLLAGAQGA
jgi:far upstream element-binding protein